AGFAVPHLEQRHPVQRNENGEDDGGNADEMGGAIAPVPVIGGIHGHLFDEERVHGALFSLSRLAPSRGCFLSLWISLEGGKALSIAGIPASAGSSGIPLTNIRLSLFSPRRSQSGGRGAKPGIPGARAPKEQPPRKLSGRRTDRAGDTLESGSGVQTRSHRRSKGSKACPNLSGPGTEGANGETIRRLDSDSVRKGASFGRHG